jgi:hypothetical protein
MVTSARKPAVEWCPDACALAKWHGDPVFGGGQYNCPHRFGVTYAAAIVDGRINCEHFKQKRKEER